MKRIDCIDSMRFFMVMAIVLCHFDFLDIDGTIGRVWNLVISRSDPAVAFFFILSGFGLEYARKDNGYSSISIKYALDRIKKLYPIYLYSIIMSVPVTLYYAISLHGWSEGLLRTIFKIPLVLVMLQSLTGIAGFSHAFNGVCWFVSTLFILYMFYPLLHKYNTRLRLTGEHVLSLILAVLIIRLLVYIVFNSIQNSTGICSYLDDLSYGTPYFRIFDFILGMLLFNLFRCYKKKSLVGASCWEVLVLILFVSYYIFRGFAGLSGFIQNVMDAAIPVWLIFIFSLEKGFVSRFLSRNIFVKMGKMTMYIFLFHYVAVLYVKAMFDVLPIVFPPKIIIVSSLITITFITCILFFVWQQISKILLCK